MNIPSQIPIHPGRRHRTPYTVICPTDFRFLPQVKQWANSTAPLVTPSSGSSIRADSFDHDFAASFETVAEDGTKLNFEAVRDSLPVVMQDQEGNLWDLFGYAVEGPRQGEKLTPTLSYTGYWFAWADFFPGIEIYQNE